MAKRWNRYIVRNAPEPDGEILFEGRISEVARFVDIDYTKIHYRFFGSTLEETRNNHQFGNYYIYMEEPELLSEPETKPKKLSRFEKKVGYTKWALEHYGNTVAWKNPTKLVKRLNNDGYFVNVVHRPERTLTHRDGNVEYFDEVWILTLTHKTTEEKAPYVAI